jgi:hypothetical protein
LGHELPFAVTRNQVCNAAMIDRAYVDGDPGEMLIEIAREGQRIDDRPSQEQAAP